MNMYNQTQSELFEGTREYQIGYFAPFDLYGNQRQSNRPRKGLKSKAERKKSLEFSAHSEDLSSTMQAQSKIQLVSCCDPPKKRYGLEDEQITIKLSQIAFIKENMVIKEFKLFQAKKQKYEGSRCTSMEEGQKWLLFNFLWQKWIRPSLDPRERGLEVKSIIIWDGNFVKNQKEWLRS